MRCVALGKDVFLVSPIMGWRRFYTYVPDSLFVLAGHFGEELGCQLFERSALHEGVITVYMITLDYDRRSATDSGGGWSRI